MFDHLSIRVTRLVTSRDFYKAALEPLGIKEERGEMSSTFGGVMLLSQGKTGDALHLAFAAKTRKEVDAFYAAALKAGGKDNGQPGLRKEYSATYYAAFVLDPDGNNIEAVTHAAK